MTRALAATALLLALLTACSNNPAPQARATAQPSPTPTTTALEAAVRSYSDAFLNGRGEAYDLLSTRCRERMTRASFLTVVGQAKAQYGPQSIKNLTVDQQAGDLARVTYTYPDPKLDQRGEPWVREDGAWRVDDC